MATSEKPLTATEIRHLNEEYWRNRDVQLTLDRLNNLVEMARFNAMMRLLHEALRWQRVKRRWETKR